MAAVTEDADHVARVRARADRLHRLGEVVVDRVAVEVEAREAARRVLRLLARRRPLRQERPARPRRLAPRTRVRTKRAGARARRTVQQMEEASMRVVRVRRLRPPGRRSSQRRLVPVVEVVVVIEQGAEFIYIKTKIFFLLLTLFFLSFFLLIFIGDYLTRERYK